jgi:agmatine/peptidylarginine deiminase
MPVYGIPEDTKAVAAIESVFSDGKAVSVIASGLPDEGGSIHCVTWERKLGIKTHHLKCSGKVIGATC